MGTFGNHNLTVMAGFENYYMKDEELTAARDKYELTGYPYLNIGSEDFQTNSGKGNEYTSNSVFGRVIYSYADRYLFQANVRHDGRFTFCQRLPLGYFSFILGRLGNERRKIHEEPQLGLAFILEVAWFVGYVG